MKKILFLVSFVLTFSFISCKNLFLLNNEEKGQISITLPTDAAVESAERSVSDEKIKLFNFKVCVQSTFEDAKMTKEAKGGESLVFEELKPGDYIISVEASSDADKKIFYGESPVSVKAGETSQASVMLKQKISSILKKYTRDIDGNYAYISTIYFNSNPVFKKGDIVKVHIKGVSDKDLPVLRLSLVEGDDDSSWSRISMDYRKDVNIKKDVPFEFNEFIKVQKDCSTQARAENSKIQTGFFIYCENGVMDEEITLNNVFINYEIVNDYPAPVFPTTIYFERVNWDNNSHYTYYFDETKEKFNLRRGEKYKVHFEGIPSDTVTTNVTFGFSENDVNGSAGKDMDNWYSEKVDFKKGELFSHDFTVTISQNQTKEEGFYSYIDLIIDDKLDYISNFKLSVQSLDASKEEHFKAEKVSNGIKVTLLKDKNSKYCYENGDSIQVLDEYNQYGFVYDKSVLDVLESEGEYSIIWPFAKEGDFITLTLGYYLENDVNNECKHEYISVESGNGECYTQGKDFDYSDMFTMDSDDSGTNSKRIIKSKVPYSDILSRVPANYKEGSLGADITFWSSDSDNPWDWTHNREWLGGFNGSFNTLNALSEPDWNDNNYYISQLFNNGFDMAALAVTKCLWYDNLWDVKIKGQYVIPVFNVSFDIKNYDVKGRFEVLNHTGVLNYTKIKHPNVYAEECDEGIKFTITKTDNFLENISIKDVESSIQIKNDSFYEHNDWNVGSSFYIIDSLVKKGNKYKFCLEGSYGDTNEYLVGDEFEITYNGEDKGSIDKDIYENYKNLNVLLQYVKNDYNDICIKLDEQLPEDLSLFIKDLDIASSYFEVSLYDSNKVYSGGVKIWNEQFASLYGQIGLNLAEFSEYGSFWISKQMEAYDLISLLANNKKTYFDFMLNVTTSNGMKYCFPSLTDMWNVDAIPFEFTVYPKNRNIINQQGLYVGAGCRVIYDNYPSKDPNNPEIPKPHYFTVDAEGSILMDGKSLLGSEKFFIFRVEDVEGNTSVIYCRPVDLEVE